MDLNYDVIVIGGGAAGLTASKLAKGLGQTVALIEKENHLGGECTWTGCVPSKALIKSARIAYYIKNSNTYGIESKNSVVDTSEVMEHVRSVIHRVYKTHTPDTLEKKGIDVLFGNAQFIDSNTIDLDGKKISFKKCIIATGSHPFVPPIEGLSETPFLTNETLFNLKTIPKSMIILGGGPIGIEMASAFNRLGCYVTVIEMKDRILQHDDEELVKILTKVYRDEGVEIQTGMKAEKVSYGANSFSVMCTDTQNKKQIFHADQLLIAVGRRANIKGLYLEKAGVKSTEKNIEVDKNLRTHAKNIYACGDVVGPYLFSHMAFFQATIAVQNAIFPWRKKMDYTNVIWVTFSAPELAHAGLTEDQARKKYSNIQIYRMPYRDLDRAMTECEETGLVKIICDSHNTIIGAHILGDRAGEIIHEVQLGKRYEISFDKLYSVIHAYPTYSELIWHAAKKSYVSKLESNIFIRIFKRVLGWWKGEHD